MVHLSTFTFFLLALAQGHNPEDSVLHRSSTLKIYETPHLRFFHTGEYLPTVRELAGVGEAFLAELEKRWSVELPEVLITVSVIRVKPTGKWMDHNFDPSWLYSRYDPESKRIELRARPQDVELDAISKAFKHHLVHAVLNIEGTAPLPTYLEEGLARFYAGSGGSRQVYWAILALQRHESLQPFLDNPLTYEIAVDWQFAGALGFQMVKWLWEDKQVLEKAFLQAHLQGQSLEEALEVLGFSGSTSLISEFDKQIRPKFGLTRILKTYDFWLLALGILALIAMSLKVIAAFRNARIDFLALEPAPATVPAELFTGPAFQPLSSQEPLISPPSSVIPDLPQVQPRNRSQPPQRPNRSETVDDFLPTMVPVLHQESSLQESVFHLDTDEFGNLDDQLDAVFDQMNHSKEPVKTNKRLVSAKIDRNQTTGEIEEDVDLFFDNLPPTRRKKTPS